MAQQTAPHAEGDTATSPPSRLLRQLAVLGFAIVVTVAAVAIAVNLVLAAQHRRECPQRYAEQAEGQDFSLLREDPNSARC